MQACRWEPRATRAKIQNHRHSQSMHSCKRNSYVQGGFVRSVDKFLSEASFYAKNAAGNPTASSNLKGQKLF